MARVCMALVVLSLSKQAGFGEREAGGEPRIQAICLAPSSRSSCTGWPGREAGMTHRLYKAGDGYIQAEVMCRPAAAGACGYRHECIGTQSSAKL